MPAIPLTEATAATAIILLKNGDVIAFPTETVYGLVADAANPAAVAKLYALKGREAQKPCQVLVKDAASAMVLGVFSPQAEALAAKHWPGALTLVVTRKADAPLAEAIYAGGDTVGLRCPDHALVQALLERFGKPLAASSANLAGEPPATTALEAAAAFPSLTAFDGGRTAGTPSTVVDCTGDAVKALRQGIISIS